MRSLDRPVFANLGDTVAVVPRYRARTIAGTVVVGRRLGRLLGAPTANIRLPLDAGIEHGSFAVEADALGRTYRGCAHVGSCPSVGGTTVGLEVHLFGFDGDLYGERLTVRFFEKVSEERQLDSLAMLKAKIARDLTACAAYFRRRDDRSS